jgi:hypothetical protein
MRYLILFLSFNLMAMINYTPEDKILGAFISQKTCEIKSGLKCYPFDAKLDNPEIMSVQDVEVDNPDDPIYAVKENATSCKIYPVYAEDGKEPHTDDCRYLIRSENIGTEETPNIVYPLCSKADFYALYVDNKDGTFEAYCTKLLGYGKMTVPKLLPDADLIAAKEAKEAQDLAEKQAKEQAKNEALTYIGEKKGNVDKLSQSEMNVLIEKILILLGE